MEEQQFQDKVIGTEGVQGDGTMCYGDVMIFPVGVIKIISEVHQ
jgi:hypothetical protein